MYGFSTRFDGGMDDAIEKVTAALADEGFGILSDIDVQAALKKKIGVERPAYRILGACSPNYANLALQADPDIGLLLPCNVVVREEDDGAVTVLFMDPNAVLALVEQPGVEVLASEVRERLMRVRDAIAAPA